MAVRVAVGGITAALSSILAAFFGLGIWIPVGMLGILLGISGPSMLIAWLKLRQRNLGPILDAGGWAVNTLAKVNIPLGTALTQCAVLPANSRRTLVDPYAPKKPLWFKIVFLLVILCGVGYVLYRFDYLNKWYTCRERITVARRIAVPAKTYSTGVESDLRRATVSFPPPKAIRSSGI